MIVSARLQLPLEPRVLGFELLDAWIDEARLWPPPTRQEQWTQPGPRLVTSWSKPYEDSAGRRWIIAFARGG